MDKHFEWFDGDRVRGVLTDAARDRYLAHCFEVGCVSMEAVDDNLVSESDLVARGWTQHWCGHWVPDPNHKFMAATRAVSRGAE